MKRSRLTRYVRMRLIFFTENNERVVDPVDQSTDRFVYSQQCAFVVLPPITNVPHVLQLEIINNHSIQLDYIYTFSLTFSLLMTTIALKLL